ncbi:MAG: CdaR family protein [Thermodesulfobacteriota bacterium]
MVDWLKKPFQHGADEGKKKTPFFNFNNIGKKVLALVIAISLWLVANLQHDVEKNIAIDVNYANIPPGLVVVNNPPQKLNLRVRGPRSQLSSVSAQNMLFTVDLSNITDGMSMFEIGTDQITPPRDVQVTGISPAEIRIETDQLDDKKVQVEPSIGPPDEGYEIVGKPEVSPKTASIEGPQNLLSKINSITTDPVSLEGEKSKFTIEAPLRSPYSIVNILGDNTVKVTIDLKERTLEKEFNDLNISYINFDGFDFETNGNTSTELTFEGPFSIINNLSSNDIELYVDGSDISNATTAKSFKLKVGVNYPNKDVLKLTKQNPKTIEIKLN